MTGARSEISPEGKARAEAELRDRREVRRPEIVAAIKAAREHGDLKENAEYHAAREEQGLNEARIRVLEHHLATAEVAEGTSHGAAAVGSRVSYRDVGGDEVVQVTLVHRLEATLAEAKISVDSPVGSALLGARKGAQVTLTTRRGDRRLEVVAVD